MKITKNWIYVPLTDKKAIFMGAVWNEKEKSYRLPNTIGVMQELYLLGFHVEQQLETKKASRASILSLKKKQDAEGNKQLRNYQRVDVNYLKHIGSSGIFNEMRTGKTPTTLALLESKNFQKVIFVVPAGLVYNWQAEAEKWTDYTLVAIKGTKNKRMTQYAEGLAYQNGFIVSYETLRNDITDVLQFIALHPTDAIVVDEAHRLRGFSKAKNKGSKAAKAVMNLAHRIPYRYALTGTPVVKEGQEIWKILHFLYPERFPGYWQFLDRYFELEYNGFGNEVVGYKRKDELQDIINLISVNRKRKEVMPWLPKKQYKSIVLDMNTKQAKMYKNIKETFEHEDKVDAPSILAQLIRLRQTTTCPDILDDTVTNEKENFITEWIADNPDEPLVVFSSFTKTLAKMVKNMNSVKMITGKQSKEEKTENARLFQEGKVNILLCNSQAARVGITLDRAENVIFMDKSYNPSDNEQAEDRIIPVMESHKHGVMITSLVMKDSVDEAIDVLLRHKYNITKVINDGGLDALQRLWKEVK